MAMPELSAIDREAQKGELVQCRITGDIWRARHIYENGNVMVNGNPDEPDADDAIILEDSHYFVIDPNVINVTEIEEDTL